MRRILSIVSALAILVGTAVPTVALASSFYIPGPGDGDDVAAGQDIFENGKGEVPACVTCHGDDGLGNDDMGTPRITGQFFTFLLKQLEDFASDKRQDTTMFVMNTNAKGLSPQDRRDVAAYLSSVKHDFTGSDLKQLAADGQTVGKTYLGKAIVEYGSKVTSDGFAVGSSQDKGVPACKSCHGYAGRGAPPLYPMIGKQRYVYLVNQLKKWRDGSRANDPKGQMQAVARKLSDDDIHNAAAYLTQASALSPGNVRTPYDDIGKH